MVERNAAARGGTEAWQRLKTMAWTGYVESAATPGRKLAFLLEQKRPNKTRFELLTDGQRSIRLYDGRSGWKLRPNAGSGRPELAPYSEDELRYARGAQVIDGPLMDGVAKGGTATLVGRDQADGHTAYVLDVVLPSGERQRVWVDAETFLEVRQDRQVRNAAGQMRTFTVLFGDYHAFEGVQIATTIETAGGAAGAPQNKLVIERVALNPEIDDHEFARPDTPVSRRNSAVVDTRGAAQRSGGPPPPPHP
ncbi:MAG: hypothetical protein JSR73_15240 [Proteobacteria bacterium]|nr:hypothetical protein [Pseudomonadota bacterium]